MAVKIRPDMIRNLAPLPRKLKLEGVNLEALGTDTSNIEFDMFVFPLTIKEEMEITQLAEQYQYKDDDTAELKKIKTEKLKESGEKLLFYTLKKSLLYSNEKWTDEQIMEFAKNMESDWQEKITREVYMFKGVDLFEIKKKEIERKLKQM